MRKNGILLEEKQQAEGNTAMRRRGKKRFLFGCAALAASGLILAVIGIAAGGMVTGIQLNGSGFHVSAPSLYRDEKQNTETEKVLEPFENIAVELDYADIRIEASETNQYAISYWMNKDQDFKYEVKDRKLVISQKHELALFSNQISWFSFGRSYEYSGKGPEVVVYVPQDTKLSEIKAGVESGNFTCSDIQADKLKLEADYGDVNVQNVQIQMLEAALESGSMSLREVQGKDFQIESDYGNLTMEQVELSGNLELALESGDVKCRDVSMRDFTLDSSYGNFTGEKLICRNVEADMESGDCKLENAAFDHWKMKMEYGNVRLITAKPLANYSYDLQTEYGNIMIDGKKVGESYSSLFEEKEKNQVIKIYSESGNIELEDKETM